MHDRTKRGIIISIRPWRRGPPWFEVIRAMVRSNSNLRRVPSAVVRYGFAVGSVAIAIAPGLVLQHYKFHEVQLPLFLFAVALTAWYAGVGPAIVPIVLS